MSSNRTPKDPRSDQDNGHPAVGDRCARVLPYHGTVRPETPEWVENHSDHSALLPIGELWSSRELVWFFALRDIRVRYKQATLGVLWVILTPTLTVAAFTLAFDRLSGVETGGLDYPIFALSGLLAWTYLAQAIARGSEMLVATPSLVTKVYFPRLTAPLAALVPPIADLGVGMLLLAVACVVYGVAPSLAFALLPLWLVLLALAAVGPVLILAALNVRFRDVRHLVAPMLQAALFLSPVAYSGANLDGAARWLFALNPAYAPVELARVVLVGAEWPGTLIVVSVASAALLAVGGLIYFQRAQRSFADVI